MAAPVLSLSSRKAVDVSLAGGKGAGLARLLKAGFPVPPGFVITTAAFREALADAAIRSTSGDSLEAARRALLAWEMPAPLRRAVLSAYRRLGGPVAVRSSMVGEDSQSGSFAGQLDTVLNVEGEDALLDAVRRVLASAFGDRLWAYLAKDAHASAGQTNLDPQAPENPRAPHPPDAHPAAHLVKNLPSLAVVVQRMVQAQVSGVAFSVDPVTGEPGIVIEAAPGLGEDLVQGRVRPDRYRLNSHGALAERAPAKPGRPLLDEAAVGALGAIVQAVAEFADGPQDVEWSFDGRRFYVLQARPISSIAGKHVYSRRMISDMAPGLVKPLVWSTKYLSMAENVFGRIFDALLGPTGADYTRLVARIRSRAYSDVTMLGELFHRVGLPVNFFEVVAREEKARWKKVRFRLRMVPAFLRFLRFAAGEWRVERRLGPFLRSQNRRLDEFRAMDWASRSPRDLVADLGRLVEVHAEAQWTIIAVSMNMVARRKLLARMMSGLVPGLSPGDVIKGYGRSESLAPFEAMKAVAEKVGRLDRGLIERMAAGAALDITAELEGSEPGRAALAAFEAFMARYGFVSANGSDFSEVPWRENPRLIWKTVARLALACDPASPVEAEAHREQALRLVRSRLGPLRRRVFDRLQAATVRFIGWRERISLLMTEDSYLMRRCALALGARLVQRGALEEEGDVFFLYRGELERLAADGPGNEETLAKIRARKAEWAEDEAVDPPDTLCGREGAAGLRPPAEGLEFLAGIGTSAGVRKGRARIVHDPALDGVGLGPADILVVPFTDVGWTPVLSGIAGIVAETGGQLSHTSIIAREFGVPAVVSVPGATRLIREGRMITVDGSAGRVYFESGESD